MSENAKVEQYGSLVKSSLALWGEDDVSYEPFTWVRSLKIGIGWFAENASFLSENAKTEQYCSIVKSSLALMEQGRGQKKRTFPLFVSKGREQHGSPVSPTRHLLCP